MYDDSYYTRLNQYRSLWVLVFFDLPTETRKDRKIATSFRKRLLDDGFSMFQFSIYMRFCASRENAEVHTKRVRGNLPPHGKVGVMQITDKQFGMMEIFYGKKSVDTEKPSQQLELF
ncbi:CRISPR-associated endoribonuclease Cas2 [Flavobacterium suaedae]|uniref:CRISPR-associated endoribonuclease Cas2 n=1 Tax=Flavobacterium suaedae TaxID=1767027 RepID=A0ABQ1JQU4_9FLAO|nr:CRISPR-associated endonuclease Cas2 [Flavobacterium suaedae]GGB73160.1 CRISPR-associated endoribonuclease Cas2 [Flavobacterium suaedae]